MRVSIRSLSEPAVPGRERLVLKVLADTDIGEYLVLRTLANDGMATADVRNVFWFPDQKVAAGDLVVLYSKQGTPRRKPLPDGSTAHFFYLGLNDCIWSQDDAAVLVHTDQWEAKGITELIAQKRGSESASRASRPR